MLPVAKTSAPDGATYAAMFATTVLLGSLRFFAGEAASTLRPSGAISRQAVNLVTEQSLELRAVDEAGVRKRPMTGVGNNDVAVDRVHEVHDPDQHVLGP